mmetsp:Transcript_27942/g.43919  ORF Transcript_27942/g.43919 Transcript_27942/m.43919 type:complete len:467 (-) Transcript_27942:67-1467(-)
MDRQEPSGRKSKRVEELENENRRLNLMARELEQLKHRMNALEVGAPVPAAAAARSEAVDVPTTAIIGSNEGGRTKSIKWAEEKTATRALLNNNNNGLDDSDHQVNMNANNDPPPMRKIKFVDHLIENTPQDLNNNQTDDDDAASYGSSSSSSSSEVIAFSGWARVFFQARHHRTSTQITSSSNISPSQDTYLHLSISSTSNVLRISDTDDTSTNNSNNTSSSSFSKGDKKPPLIDPPIPLKYFHAVKVPGSNSGAALFLKNDTRRLRKYIFRFEFVNRSVHQPPQRYIQFLRSGNAAKKSMRSYNKMKRAFKGLGVGEERNEKLKEDKKKATDAFAAHLGTLDELLRESNDLAERFVECVNTRNEEEDLMMSQAALMAGAGTSAAAGSSSGVMGIKRSRPPPPYWGSGFNRPSTNDQDDDIESDSDFSDDDEELYYDDDNDDETLFDKVQVSTEQTLETLWNQIVK